jgi:methionyl-tRNA formyltransferase
MKKKIVFMGTPIFATAVLNALLDMDVEVLAVVTQPDKKVGRKQVLSAPPVKLLALEHQLPVLQPNRVIECLNTLKDYKPDAIVTCAYGMFLPQEILDVPLIECINVHASLLPKYRGGAPIHRAVMAGEQETGISLMRMIKKMDAGEVFVKESITIGSNETTSDVHDRLMALANRMVKEHLLDILNLNVAPTVQEEALVTFAPIITAEDEHINLEKDGETIYNQIRGLIKFPYGYVIINDLKVKIIEAEFIKKTHNNDVNTIVGFNDDGMIIAINDGLLIIKKLQVQGKRIMDASQVKHGLGKKWIGLEVK